MQGLRTSNRNIQRWICRFIFPHSFDSWVKFDLEIWNYKKKKLTNFLVSLLSQFIFCFILSCHLPNCVWITHSNYEYNTGYEVFDTSNKKLFKSMSFYKHHFGLITVAITLNKWPKRKNLVCQSVHNTFLSLSFHSLSVSRLWPIQNVILISLFFVLLLECS